MLQYLLAGIGTIIAFVGAEGRGALSHRIAMIGGPIWLAGVILGYVRMGWKNGTILLLATFLLYNILERVFKRILNPKNRPPRF